MHQIAHGIRQERLGRTHYVFMSMGRLQSFELLINKVEHLLDLFIKRGLQLLPVLLVSRTLRQCGDRIYLVTISFEFAMRAG